MTTNQTNPLKRWLTIQEVEKEYGFNRNAQNRMRRELSMPYSKVGKKVRYDRALLDAWLEDHSVNVEVRS